LPLDAGGAGEEAFDARFGSFKACCSVALEGLTARRVVEVSNCVPLKSKLGSFAKHCKDMYLYK